MTKPDEPLLAIKQEKFCRYLARGFSIGESVLFAYGFESEELGWGLLMRKDVYNRVRKLNKKVLPTELELELQLIKQTKQSVKIRGKINRANIGKRKTRGIL